MRGSIGGTVFSRNRYGAVARNRSKPVDPGSSLQSVMRQAVMLVSTAWNATLTAAQRSAWDAYAAAVPWVNGLGETQNLTGFNMFVRSNCSGKQAGLTTFAAGPTELSLPEGDPSLTVIGTADDQKISFAFNNALDWANETGAYMLCYASAPKNETRNFFKGPYRYVGKIVGNDSTAPTSPTLFTAPFSIAAGQKVFAQCRIVRADGRLSQPFRTSGLVAAT